MRVELLATIAGILTSIRLIPQVIKSFRTKSTRDLSLYFIVMCFFQAIFLILYGASKPDYAILGMNIMPLICSSILGILKYKYRQIS
jgi:MtN3 and saliva related transmembrane protein